MSELTCTMAEEGLEISNDNKRWNDRTDRMTVQVRAGMGKEVL
jgi:hypothetical protein